MNCQTLETLLVDFLYEEVEGAQKTELSEHLSSCQGCQEKLASFEQVQLAFQELKEPAFPSFSYTALLAEAEAEAQAMASGYVSEKEVLTEKASASKQKESSVEGWSAFWEKCRRILTPPIAVPVALVLLAVTGFFLLPNMKSPQEIAPSSFEAQTETKIAQNHTEPAEQPLIVALNEKDAVEDEGVESRSAEIQKEGYKNKKGLSIPSPSPELLDNRKLNISSGTPAQPSFSEGKSKKAKIVTLEAGEQAFRQGFYEEASDLFRTLTQTSSPGSSAQNQALSGLSQSEALLQRCDDAEKIAENLLEGSKEWSQAMLTVASCYIETQKTKKGRELYQELANYSISQEEANDRLASLRSKSPKSAKKAVPQKASPPPKTSTDTASQKADF